MLRIFQNRSAASALSYYSRAQYYGESHEKPGHWHGRLASMQGLSGRIRESDFKALRENRDPRTGKQVTARHNHDRTVGYDFSWHVPKGVSLAYALGNQRIEEVFEQSVMESMQEIEAEVQTRVRMNGRQETRTTSTLAWESSFTRPADRMFVFPGNQELQS